MGKLLSKLCGGSSIEDNSRPSKKSAGTTQRNTSSTGGAPPPGRGGQYPPNGNGQSSGGGGGGGSGGRAEGNGARNASGRSNYPSASVSTHMSPDTGDRPNGAQRALNPLHDQAGKAQEHDIASARASESSQPSHDSRKNRELEKERSNVGGGGGHASGAANSARSPRTEGNIPSLPNPKSPAHNSAAVQRKDPTLEEAPKQGGKSERGIPQGSHDGGGEPSSRGGMGSGAADSTTSLRRELTNPSVRSPEPPLSSAAPKKGEAYQKEARSQEQQGKNNSVAGNPQGIYDTREQKQAYSSKANDARSDKGVDGRGQRSGAETTSSRAADSSEPPGKGPISSRTPNLPSTRGLTDAVNREARPHEKQDKMHESAPQDEDLLQPPTLPKGSRTGGDSPDSLDTPWRGVSSGPRKNRGRGGVPRGGTVHSQLRTVDNAEPNSFLATHNPLNKPGAPRPLRPSMSSGNLPDLTARMDRPLKHITSIENMSSAWNRFQARLQPVEQAAKKDPRLRDAVRKLITVSANVKPSKLDLGQLTTINDTLHGLVPKLQSPASIPRSLDLWQPLEWITIAFENAGNAYGGNEEKTRVSRLVDGGDDAARIIDKLGSIRQYADFIDLYLTLRTQAARLGIDLEGALKPVKSVTYTSQAPRSIQERTIWSTVQDLEQWAARSVNDKPLRCLTGRTPIQNSTIARSMCENLDMQGILGSSFFCSSSPDPHDIPRIIPTLAFQLAHRVPGFMVPLSRLLKERKAEPFTISDQLKHLLLEPLASINKKRSLLIVIDGLDRCAEQETQPLFDAFTRHTARIQSLGLRILFTTHGDKESVVPYVLDWLPDHREQTQ